MRLIDPEFQRALADVCLVRRIPLIVDEVFTGFWRLGAPSGASMLGISPDIACYAKLLTGGIVPMALTLASDAVFRAFEGDSKEYALLHGHSYTAHPVGCAAAIQALEAFTNPSLNSNVCTPHVEGRCLRSGACTAPCGNLHSQWNSEAIAELSHRPDLERVISLGTLLVVELKSSEAGYTSNAAAGVIEGLRKRGVYARPLGNVVYIMVTPMTDAQRCDHLLKTLEEALDSQSKL